MRNITIFNQYCNRLAREAESEAEKLSQSNKAGLFWNLASAAKKIGEKELECESYSNV